MDKQDDILKQGLVNDEFPTFSLGLTQEWRQEDCHKITRSKLVGRTKADILAEKYGTSGTLDQGLDAPRSRVVGWTKADILAEKNKVIAELEAKKVVSKNTSKQDSIKESSDNCDEKGKSLHQGFIEPNVGEEETEARKDMLQKSTKVESLNKSSDKCVDSGCENEDGKKIIQKTIDKVEERVEQKNEASKAFHETNIGKSKRIKGVSKHCKSPYLVREVEITNRNETGEGSKRVKGGSKKDKSRYNEMEVIFETSNGAITEARFFKTLIPGNRIYGEIIDCWAAVLNKEEKLRSPDSQYRLLCVHRVFLKWMFTAPKTDESIRLVALTKMMYEAVGRIENMRDLKSYDIVIIPILENDHFYVMTFDLKNPGIYLVDNMDKDETVVSIKDHQD
ncbi:hypothetical protein R6Q59_006144 [Mikania micrantha]